MLKLQNPKKTHRIGWVVDSSPQRVLKLPWQKLSPVGFIRYGQMAQHLNRTTPFRMELFRPWNQYDAVIFVKMMNPSCQNLAHRLQSHGVKVIFDANINYYEDWGEFIIPGTRPTADQKENAIRMTKLADWVVADSRYIARICTRFNDNVSWVPDCVDTNIFIPKSGLSKDHNPPLKLVWCGIGKKAYSLELIEPVLMKFNKQIQLNIITSPNHPTNPWPPVLFRLAKENWVNVQEFDQETFPTELQNSDLIISPRQLENSYEMGHTEYKVMVGMASGLGVLASPQMAYVDALNGTSAGYICHTQNDWDSKINHLIQHPEEIIQMGKSARERAESHYSIQAISQRFELGLKNTLENKKNDSQNFN